MKNLNNKPSAFEITYVDTNDSHYPNRNVQTTSGSSGKKITKSIKGGLKKQSVIVRGNNQSRVSVEFFAAHPTYKLMGIVPVKTEVDPNALALLLTPDSQKRVKPAKQAKTFDPRSVAGFLAYVDATAQRAA